MDEMTTNFYIKQSRVMVVGRMTTGSVCDRQQKETAIMAMHDGKGRVIRNFGTKP